VITTLGTRNTEYSQAAVLQMARDINSFGRNYQAACSTVPHWHETDNTGRKPRHCQAVGVAEALFHGFKKIEAWTTSAADFDFDSPHGATVPVCLTANQRLCPSPITLWEKPGRPRRLAILSASFQNV